MSYATTHIISSMFGFSLFKKKFQNFKKFLPNHYFLIAAIGGMIPDLDIAAYYILYFFGYSFDQIHRTFMHSLFVPAILFLIGICIYAFSNKKEKSTKAAGVFFIFTICCLIHLSLDFIDGKIMPFYPLSTFSVGLDLLKIFPSELEWVIPPIFDGMILLAWIFWMNLVKKKDDLF